MAEEAGEVMTTTTSPITQGAEVATPEDIITSRQVVAEATLTPTTTTPMSPMSTIMVAQWADGEGVADAEATLRTKIKAIT